MNVEPRRNLLRTILGAVAVGSLVLAALVAGTYYGFRQGFVRGAEAAVPVLVSQIYANLETGNFDQLASHQLTTRSVATELQQAERTHGRVKRWRIRNVWFGMVGLPIRVTVDAWREGPTTEVFTINSPLRVDQVTVDARSGVQSE